MTSTGGDAHGLPSVSAASSAGTSTSPAATAAAATTSTTTASSVPAASESSTPDAGSPSPPTDESGGIDHSELYERIKARPCRVADVQLRVSGPDGKPPRTRPHLIERELDRVYNAETLEEIHEALQEAGTQLNALRVFRDIDLLVHEEPENDPEAVSVVLSLEEKNWYKLHAGTYVQGGENSAEIGIGLHNLTGHAEHFDVTAEYGSEASNTMSATYVQPRPAGLPLILDLRVHQLFRNSQKTSSFMERLRGGIIGIKSLDNLHALQYELGWRSITDPSRQASKAVLEQCGDYLKSSARYVFLIDRRNDMSPSLGWAFKAMSEIGGLGPDERLRYGKHSLDAAVVLPLSKLLSIQLTAGTGLLLPWGGADPLARTTSICERFFVGGAGSLRGFKFKGVGPTDVRRPASRSEPRPLGEAPPAQKRDALGGDLYATLMAALVFRLPHPSLQSLGIQGQAFVNAGNVVQLAGSARHWRDSVTDFTSTFRTSAGVGLLLPTWFGRFEANYVWVLKHQQHDKVKRGLQLGFASSVFAF